MTARARRSLRGAQRLAVTALLCALLAAGAAWAQSDKAAQNRGYRLKAADLLGVTRLRVEGNAVQTDRYRPSLTRVYMDEQPDVLVRVRSNDGQDPTAAGANPRLTASRENDLLVLRWSDAPGGPVRASRMRPTVGNLILPKRFTQLTMEYGYVEMPNGTMERLQVSGAWVRVLARIGHLDLHSTLCHQPCSQEAIAASSAEAQSCALDENRGWHKLLRLQAGAEFGTPSLRVSAMAGIVDLTGAENIKQLELHLAGAVDLSVDSAALLDPARTDVSYDFNPPPPAICSPLLVTAPAPGAVALEFWPDTPGSEKPAQ